MHPFIVRMISVLALITFFFTSCKKEIEINKPIPQPSPKSNLYQFVITSLPGEPETGVSGLSAQVMVVNEQNQTVLDNVKLPLQFDGSYKTNRLELPDGNYRVVKFLIKNEANKVVYVAPVAGSVKAPLVTKPLPFSFSLPQQALVSVQVEVLKREMAERAESFGYPSGTFDQVDAPQTPDQGSPNFKIKIRPSFTIGDIVYDSVPTGITLRITDISGQVTTKYLSLTAGTNIIEVPRTANRYQFQVSHWGISDELVLDKSQVNEQNIYRIGGSKAAKRLKTEIRYKLVNGVYVAESKLDYLYDGSGKISRIDYFKKKSDGTPYLEKYDQFTYEQGKIKLINHMNGQNELKGSIAFTYDQEGRVKTLRQDMDGEVIQGTITYLITPDINSMSINYSYSKRYYTAERTLTFRDGNVNELWSTTSHGDLEKGMYDYDFNINPYAHLKLPNLLLSNSSKNNLKMQYKEYANAYPEADPISFNYTYDSDGYPKQLISNYWAPGRREQLYTLKTVYTYF